MKIKNLAIALFLAVGIMSTSAIYSQNDTNNNDLAFSNSQTVMVAEGDRARTNEVEGVWIPD